MGLLRSISLSLYICQQRYKSRDAKAQPAQPDGEGNAFTRHENSCISYDSHFHKEIHDGFVNCKAAESCFQGDFNVSEPWWSVMDALCYLTYVPLALTGPNTIFE